jgi:hypothetical protein
MTYSMQIGPRLFRRTRVDNTEVVEYLTEQAFKAHPHMVQAMMPEPRKLKPTPTHWDSQQIVTLANGNAYLVRLDRDGQWWEAWAKNPEHMWEIDRSDVHKLYGYAATIDTLLNGEYVRRHRQTTRRHHATAH